MKTALKLLTLMHHPGAGIPAVVYLLRDEFTTPESAPLASPRTCEPGPGTLTLTQTDGQFSISGGKLVYPAQTTPTWSDLGFYAEKQGGGAFSRVAGRAYQFTFNNANTVSAIPFIFSWHNSTSLGSSSDSNTVGALLFEGGTFRVIDGASYVALPSYATWVASSDEAGVIVVRGTGFLAFKKLSGVWSLVWVGVLSTTASLYPVFKNYMGQGTMDFVRVRDLVMASNMAWAALYQASPVSGNLYTGVADGTFDLVVTSPSSLANQTELRFRVQDASNYWVIYLDSAGALKVSKFVSGVEAVQTNVASVIGTSATRRIRIMTNGNKINAFSLNGTTWTPRGSEISDTFLQTATGVQVQIGSGWTGTELGVWSFADGWNGVG